MKIKTIIACIIVFGTQSARADPPTPAAKANDFLNSIGACVHIQHHQDASKLVEPLKFTGLRNVRDGADTNYDMTGLLLLHKQAGVMVCFGPGSGAKEDSLGKTMTACHELAAADALLAIEGPNEPNNFGGVTWQGQNSTKLKSWLPVANYQRSFYQAVKADPALKKFPVFGISEAGAEDDNAGLQFLTIPDNAGTLMPDGTQYCDFLNCHNYVCGHIKGEIDNQATLAASVNPKAAIDHLFGNHGKTWRKKFAGYTEQQLATLPKVTTETGWKTEGTPAGDHVQGVMLMNVFLAQFKAGWAHTFIYEFADDSDGAFGFYKSDLSTPRKSAEYMHNFTTVLADNGADFVPGKLAFSIPNEPATVHEMLLQKSDGVFELVVWGEQMKGSNDISVEFGESHGSVKVYDPTVGVTPVKELANVKSVPMSVGDHALVIEISK